ncbi:adapter SH3BGRL [Paroedura picta]|uniref:adapter SH3BGRL n=1 Tax=Paroedura picta TaxID=143630 RepID=UPI0040576428
MAPRRPPFGWELDRGRVGGWLLPELGASGFSGRRQQQQQQPRAGAQEAGRGEGPSSPLRARLAPSGHFAAAAARARKRPPARRMVIKVYIASSSGSTAIKKQQQDVLGFLEANKIAFEEKDIAANEENRKWMRENVPEDSRPASGNPLPPRLFNDSRYLGDYEAFFEARENNAVYAFLGLTAPPGSKEAEALAKQEA